MGRALLESLATAVTRHRGVVLSVLFLVLAVLALQIPRLEADFTPQDLFTSFEDQERIVAEFQEAFGHTENAVLVLLEAPDVTQVEPLQFVHDLSLRLMQSPYLARVEGITVSPLPQRGVLGLPRVEALVEGETVEPEEALAVREAVSDSPLIEGRLISGNLRVAVVPVFLAGGMSRIEEFAAAIDDIRRILAELTPPSSVEVRLAGLPYLRTVVVERFRADQRMLIPLSLLACMLILLLTVRWFPGVYLPLAAVAISAVMVVGGMALFGEPINIINNIVPALIIIIGISNSIHIIGRYREELRRGESREAATRNTVMAMGVACFLTSFTTAIGFGSLLISRTELLKRFGVTAAIGIMLSYVVTITFVPVLLTIVRRRKADVRGAEDGWIEAGMARLTRWILERPWPVLACAAVVLAAATVATVVGSEVDNSVFDQFDPDDEIVLTTRLMEAELDGVLPLEVSLSSPEGGFFANYDVINRVTALKDWILDQPGVLSVTSYSDYLHEAWALMTGDRELRTTDFPRQDTVEVLLRLIEGSPRNPLAQYLTADRARSRLSVMIADIGAQKTIALGSDVRAHAEEQFSELGVDVVLTGDAYINARGLDAVIDDLVGSLLLAVVVIFGFLTLLFRNPRLGLLSIPPNIIPLVVTAAYMAVRDVRLNTATAMIFAISIGLAVDATIHLVVRFMEEEAREKTPLDVALVEASRGAGRAIGITCFMLMAGFSVMMASAFPPIRRFGELIAVTAFGTLAGNLIVLPALLKVGWNRPYIGPRRKSS